MQKKTLKSALINFHIVGLLLSAKFILSTQSNSIFAFLTLFTSVSIIFVLYRITIRFRESECDGIISYFDAFKYIFLIYFLGSIVSSIVVFIYTQFINKDFLSFTLDFLLKTYEKMKIHIDNPTYSVIEKIYKPLPYSLLNIIASIFTATFWSLILSAFIKKEKSIFE